MATTENEKIIKALLKLRKQISELEAESKTLGDNEAQIMEDITYIVDKLISVHKKVEENDSTQGCLLVWVFCLSIAVAIAFFV
ncbi:hypothetical protein [Picosynechococcus sp. PCC 8807]|uniref:hypothetical protein n=1 Tax=Picosynechococcus sp. PCC 8807 TaxID=195248 RepID=UPI000810EECD|nr:hypothetical protein [Picosynechococcus sp. PCC 8807]ANV90671.1 hypothetical protein AWQ24_08540 [Picosynechococcus sp. PCC 8807]